MDDEPVGPPRWSQDDANLRREFWGATLRLILSLVGLLLIAVQRPDLTHVQWAIAGYVVVSAVGVWFVRRGVGPRWRVPVFLASDVIGITLVVYGFGSTQSIVAVLYFPLLAGFVLQRHGRTGAWALVLSLLSYVGLVSLEVVGVLPSAPLLTGPIVPAEVPRAALTTVVVLVMSVVSAYVVLHLTLRRMEEQERALRELVAAERAAREDSRLLQERLNEVQRLESLGRLAGGVAHDFNNHLTAIIGYAECLGDELPGGSPLRADVDEVLRAGKHAAQLTSQLLAFSRKQVIRPRTFDLNELVGQVRQMLGRLIGEDVRLLVEPAEQDCPIHADPAQIEQLIVNLAVNARDAMPRGGSFKLQTERLTLAEGAGESRSELPAGDYVRLTVGDSGSGMDEETARQIFEPFFTTKPKGEGTGLGLATVYGIVRQHGGVVEVDTAVDEGTTFRILLPASQERSADEVEEAPADPTGQETILVAEDESAVRRLVERVLSRRGYAVLVAARGVEALEVAAQHQGPIALLLTDVVMPGMSGSELAERLAEQRPEIRVLYMSGYTAGAIVDDGGVLVDGTVLLQKPFNDRSLLAAVRSALDG